MRIGYNLILIIIGYFIVNGIYVPAMPDVADFFGADGSTVRASMTLFQLGALLACIAAGFIADSIGKKNFLVSGLATAVLGSLMCLSAGNLELLFVGRFLQGAGSAIGFMMGFALIIDIYEPQNRLKLFALNGVMLSLASISTPYIGGNLVKMFNWRASFVFILPVFAFALFNVIKDVPAKANIRKPTFSPMQDLLDYIRVFTNRTYFCYVVINAIFIGCITYCISFLPFFLGKTFHLTEDYIGIFIGITIWMPYGIGSYYSVKIYNKFGVDNVLGFGHIVCAITAVSMIFMAYAFETQLLMIAGIMTMFFLGFGIMYTGSISQSMGVFLDLTTKASSLRTILISFFAFFGGLGAQYSSDNNLMYLAIAMIVTATLSSLFFVFRGVKSNS
ncbi:MAG: MFS transporter [Alphaproteobacteria bacterium]|nr:MFS transporter [Alphaproteobacteria bacterium]